MHLASAHRGQNQPIVQYYVKGAEPGYVYRIVNDVGDRVSSLQEQGYEIVTDNSVKIGDRRVGKASQDGSPVQVSVGGGVQGFLMRQKQEYYDEDQKYKQQQIQETERAMKKILVPTMES